MEHRIWTNFDVIHTIQYVPFAVDTTKNTTESNGEILKIDLCSICVGVILLRVLFIA